MGQVTIYLDDETEQKMVETARDLKLSKSKWVGGIIREKLQSDWPQSVRAAAGSWADLPSLVSLRSDAGSDVERESL